MGLSFATVKSDIISLTSSSTVIIRRFGAQGEATHIPAHPKSRVYHTRGLVVSLSLLGLQPLGLAWLSRDANEIQSMVGVREGQEANGLTEHRGCQQETCYELKQHCIWVIVERWCNY